jgi:hypothetical protein
VKQGKLCNLDYYKSGRERVPAKFEPVEVRLKQVKDVIARMNDFRETTTAACDYVGINRTVFIQWKRKLGL